MLRGVIFDFMRTLYNPEEGRLYYGVLEILDQFLELNLKLGLVTYGSAGKKLLLEQLGLSTIFHWYQVVEVKTPYIFMTFVKKYGLDTKDVLVVGDLVTEEIAIGKDLGMKTVWVKQNPHSISNKTELVPDYTIDNIMLLEYVVTSLMSRK